MLQIDRLSLHVRAAAAPERAERLARRLRDAALGGIERGRYRVPASHVFVDRLAVQCSVSSEWDDAAIGAEVARSLAAALAASAERPDTVAFRSRAELVAAFYSALAEGRAWEQWWLEEFDGLKALPASAALRTSVMNEGATGISALARLTESSLSRVLALLGPVDAGRLLQWFGARAALASPGAVSLWKIASSIAPGGDEARALLRALVGLERAAPGAAGAGTLQGLREMAALRAAAMRGELEAIALRDAPAGGVLRALAAKLSLEGRWLESLGDAEAQSIAEELGSLAPPARSAGNGKDSPAAGAAHEPLFTPHGGAFLLLKALDWLGWPASWAGASGNDELARGLAWAISLRALFPHAAREALADPALHLAFGLERPLALLRGCRHESRAILKNKLSETAYALLGEFSRRIPGLAGASAPYVRRNALALPASVERLGGRCVVRLGRAPLDVLLVLAGAKSGHVALPGGPAVELRAEAGA